MEDPVSLNGCEINGLIFKNLFIVNSRLTSLLELKDMPCR